MNKEYTIEEDIIKIYRIVFPDGSKSIAYNKTRASEFIRRLNDGEQEDVIKIRYTI